MPSPEKSPARPDVLVVGAGPAGLTVAHELARRGIGVRVVDQAAGPAVTSRATANHARNLEVYHQMGVIDQAVARGQRAANFSIHRGGRCLIRFGTDYSDLPTRYPFTLQLDQVHTEQILRERLAQFGVEVEWGLQLAEFAQDDDGVRGRLVRTAGKLDGAEESIDVPWLVGGDGAHSTIRKALDIPLLGESTERWLVADAVIDLGLRRDSLHLLHTGKGTILLVPFPAENKWRLLDTLDNTDADDYEAVRGRFVRKLSTALRRPIEVETPTWVSVFTIQQRMVRTMQQGRCFLVGDAAHVHSPASGQGMNTGIQDGHNLAWKLADVIAGYAGPQLLTSFEAERVPIGETLLASTKKATALIALRNFAAPVLMPLGLGFLRRATKIKLKIERTMLRGMSGLALEYSASPLSLPAPDGAGPRPGERVGCSVETLEQSVGWQHVVAEFPDPRWLLLSRPDGAGDAAELAKAEASYARAVSVRAVSAAGVQGPGALDDPDGRLVTDLGLAPGDWVLVRPDGYVAARGARGTIDAAVRRVHLLPATAPEVVPAPA